MVNCVVHRDGMCRPGTDTVEEALRHARKQTLLCTYLSAVLLVGLVLNATLGWSWADPAAALVIAAIAVKEGRAAWQGKGCCTPAAAAAPSAGAEALDACGCRPGCDCCN